MEEECGIVVVGAGLCGLATALALHKKGISSVVLERSPELRSEGSAISLHVNGWRVLDQLGIGDTIRRRNTVVLKDARDEFLFKTRTPPVEIFSHEFRFVRRMDIVTALADALPPETIRFNCQVTGIALDRATSLPDVFLADGRTLKAKVVIGCDGSNSVVAKFLGLKPARPFPIWQVRGITSYPDGHDMGGHFIRVHDKRSFVGRVAIDANLVHFFIGFFPPFDGTDIKGIPEQIKEQCLAQVQNYPVEIVDMVKNCDVESLNITRIWYRAPWHINPFKCRKGTVTIAGDAMHVMGPFLGQGGASGLEDALVLARQLAPALPRGVAAVREAQWRYLKERLPRVIGLVLHTVLFCTFLETSSPAKRTLCALAMVALFGGLTNVRHIQYDCGPL